MADVSNGLNLFLRLRDPTKMRDLLGLVQGMQPSIRRALEGLHYVHFARFVPSPDMSTLLVITEFDGEMKSYVMDFAAVIGDEFTRILEFVDSAPPLPVQAHPREFWDFIQRNSQPRVPLWSAYEDKTVLDILGPRRELPPDFADARPSTIQLDDVQGNVLRGYGTRAEHAHHIALVVKDAAAARRFIGGLTDGSLPLQVTTAADWDKARRPDHFLNIGFTHLGLAALGVPAPTLRQFPDAYRMGPAAADRASQNGDIDGSDPKHWLFGGHRTAQVHVMLSVHADSAGALGTRVGQLGKLAAAGGLQEIWHRSVQALPGRRVHFGYRDSIGQPRIARTDGTDAAPDRQPAAAAGDFLLGRDYVNQGGGNYIGQLPAALCDNGTYAAVRLLRQDVAAFHRLLDEVAARHGLSADMVAAKLLGRWPSGAPLSVHPEADGGAVHEKALNDFDFAPTPRHPSSYDDGDGRRCPIGSHIRRMNPRGSLVAGKPYNRRIIRRGMAYGPPYDPAAEPPGDPAEERGLFGLFICGDLENQFEFLLQFWANGDLSASGHRGMQDPILGTQKMGGQFVFHTNGSSDPISITLPRLVTTRGSVYLFMPGIGGLRHLAGLAPRPGGKTTMPSNFDPSTFNPNDPAFLADPYPRYAEFRKHKPVHFVTGKYQSHWVFTHELVTEVLERDEIFLKNRTPPPLDGSMGDVLYNMENGLFFMDPPRHTVVRKMLDPLFDAAIQGIAPKADAIAAQLIAMIQPQAAIELIKDYALLLPAQVFMAVFGIDPNHAKGIIGWVNAALDANNKALKPEERFPGFTARSALGAYFQALRPGCPMGQQNMLSQMHTHAEKPARHDGMSPVEFQQTAAHFALGGYLSTEFLIATGIYNLLKNPAELDRLRTTPALLQQAVEEMLRYDAPFQLTDRYVAKNTMLGAYPLLAGERVTMVFGSANRDEKVFSNPDRFDITRVPDADPARRHFSLGRGRHHCIGAPLVDIVAPLAIWKFVDALKDMKLDPTQPVEWRQDPYFRSPAKFPLLTR